MNALDAGSAEHRVGARSAGLWRRWLLLAVLALLLVLAWSADTGAPRGMPRLLFVLNLLFSIGVALPVSFAWGVRFLASRKAADLLPGCGTLAWGLSTGIATLSLPSFGADSLVTIHDLGIWTFSLCQLASVIPSSLSDQPLSSPKRWMVGGHSGALLLVLLMTRAERAGWLPLFFLEGTGGTPLRQLALGSAIAMLLLAATLLWRESRRLPASFADTPALGLAILALGLLGSMLQKTTGGPLAWVALLSQYVGGACLLANTWPQGRNAGKGDFSLSETLRTALESPRLLTALQDPSPGGLILRYGIGLLAPTLAFGVYQAFTTWVGTGLPTYITFYPALMLVAMLAGPGPGLLATITTVALVDVWILPPASTPGLGSPIDRLSVVLFTGCGALISLFAEFYRRDRHKAAIYDQEQVLHDVRKDNDFLAEVLERASLPFAVSYPDGRLGRFNRAFCELTGYSGEELRALDSSNTLTPPEWREPERLKLEELNRTGHPVRYAKECITKAGTRVSVELLVHLVRDGEGRPDYYYSFLTDITEQKRAASLLQRYELLARHTSDIVLFVELWSGRILEANAAAAATYGYSHEELLQLSIQDLRTQATRETLSEQLTEANSKGILFETTHQRKDGSTIPVEVNSIGTTIGSDRVLLSMIRDITHRKRWEETLQESESALRAILDATRESVWLFDREGTILATNRTALERLQVTLAEVAGKPITLFIPPELAKARMEKLAQAVETGLPVRYEDERKGIIFDHTFYPVPDAGGNILRVAAYSHDITQARRAEEELRKTNARIRLLAESASALLVYEDPEHLMESLCRKVMEFLDCQVFFHHTVTKDQDRLHLVASFGIPGEEAACLESLPFDLAECVCPHQGSCPILRDGLWNSTDPRAHVMRSCGILAHACHPLLVNGLVHGTLFFGTNNRSQFTQEEVDLMKAVADQASSALHRIQSKKALEHINTKLEAVNEELSLKGRELRLVNAELIASNQRLEQRVTDRTQELNTRMSQLQTLAGQLNRAEEEERRRIAQIIHDHLQQLLVAARLNVDTLRARNVDDAAGQSLRALYRILTESLQVARSLTAELYPSVLHRDGLRAALDWLSTFYLEQHGLSVRVEADPEAEVSEPEMRIMLFRAVRELLFNVVKHAGVDSARVRLTRPDQDHVRLEVMDEGAGFDPVLAQAGEDSNIGFGLFSLQQRLELFGGTLEIQSFPGRGSHFTITAPISLPPQPRQPEDPARESLALDPPVKAPIRHASVRILLVDDHKVVREGLAQILNDESDFEIIGQAANGKEAMEAARRLDPQVVLMDAAMPVMNGIEATRLIMLEMPHIKILGLSMYNDPSHAEAMREAGAVAFMDKGGPIGNLKAEIRRHAGLS